METIGDQVLQYLPDTIQTFSNSNKKTISSLIQSIKSDKTQIGNLVENLRSFDLGASYTPALALRYSPMNVEAIIEFFRDSGLRVSEFFSASSSISNILESMVGIFSSEIQKVEKDIEYLETFIDNYQYIAGEDDLFNFNYIENFDNDLNSYKSDGVNLPLVDRDNNNFSENGNYAVDNILSKLKINNGSSFVNIIGNIKNIDYRNNYSDFVTTDTQFESLINEKLSDNWTVTIKSPYVLTSQMPDLKQYVSYDYSYIRGAQSQVVLEFNNDIEMDFIRLTPTDANGMQLLQIVLDKTDPTPSQNTGVISGENILFPVLNAPLTINKTVDVIFTKCRVKKVIFIFNQPKYVRSQNIPNIHETNSKYISNIIKKIRNSKKNTPSKLQDLIYFYFKNASDIQKNRKNTNSYSEIYSYRYPINYTENNQGVMNIFNSTKDVDIQDKVNGIIEENNINVITNIVQTIVLHSIDNRNNIFQNNIYKSSRSDSYSNLGRSINSDGIVPLKNDIDDFGKLFQREDPMAPGTSSFDITKYLNSKEITNSYEYSFSLRNISFGVNSNVTLNKACFISKKIETQGSVIGIKAIANIIKERQNLNYTNLDLREPGSVELSISFSENIISESNWIPILHSLNNKVDSEVLFFNNIKNATLRFKPKSSTIKIYKNGLLENPNNWSYATTLNIISYNQTPDAGAIYVIEYEVDQTDYNQSILDLTKVNAGSVAIKSYSSSGKQGQEFSSTGPGNKVKLEHIPYIEDKFSTASYNDNYGTINTIDNIGYSPISIILNDGSTAINLTNYLSNSFEKASFYQTTEYLFYQNGKDIIFNRPINEKFTVQYNYIPSAIRFRAIIRNNVPGQNNGISLDSVILKSKVQNLDPFSQKLLRLN
jgi:hypothetical protein